MTVPVKEVLSRHHRKDVPSGSALLHQSRLVEELMEQAKEERQAKTILARLPSVQRLGLAATLATASA
jgi:dihydrodipicolinate reductase